MSTPTATSLAARILKERGKPAPSHPVTVHIAGKNAQGIDCEVSDLDAVLVFVPDLARLATVDAATAALAGKNPTPERQAAEEAYHLLAEALRNPAQRAERVFAEATEAKALLVEKEAIRLRNEYQRFVDVHYPDSISGEEIAQIEEAARRHFLPDLLTSFGLLRILRALPSLAGRFGAPLIANSSPSALPPG